jgi:UDP-3-O-[3-hydroxymyristoyl] glucosamine N-acyltransferase
VVVARIGISGSVIIEDFVVLAARVGVHDHLGIGEGAQIAALAIVSKEVPAGARLGGWPAKPVRQWMREVATLVRLAGHDRGLTDRPDDE